MNADKAAGQHFDTLISCLDGVKEDGSRVRKNL